MNDEKKPEIDMSRWCGGMLVEEFQQYVAERHDGRNLNDTDIAPKAKEARKVGRRKVRVAPAEIK